MNQPQRLKAASALGHEGRLMASGSEEMPDPEAIHRAARRLSISATVLASAVAATAVAPAATAATTAVTSGGIGTVGTAIGKATGSLLMMSVVKGTVIGLSLGITVFAGAHLVRSNEPAKVPNLSPAVSIVLNRPRPKADNPGVASATSVFQDAVPVTAAARVVSPSQDSPAQAMVTGEPAAPSVGLAPAAALVGHFEDLESPAVLPSPSRTSTDLLPSQGPGATPATATRAGALPVDPRLAREVASLDQSRAYANRGNAVGALRELDGFEASFGYVALRKEAMLVRIDVLLALGRRKEAAATARQLLLSGAPATQRARLQDLVRNQP